jgi:hypothetical protein
MLLARSVVDALRSGAAQKYRWAGRLRAFLDGIQQDALNWKPDREFAPSRIIAVPKGRPGSRMKYRILSIYNLHDTILASGYAAYLRDVIDPALGDECVAFRPGSGAPPPKHHDAMRAVIDFAGRHNADAPLWVAECDIKGFFDSVSHKVIWSQLRAILNDLCVSLAPQAQRFLEAFLAGYDYESAMDRATRYLAARRVRNPSFACPSQAYQESGMPIPDRYGIPQGSAISCILANVVLCQADRTTLAKDSSKDGLYVRYCDDIVIVHPNKSVAGEMLAAYREKLNHLSMPTHEPPSVEPPYGRSFWKHKTKTPYRWQDSTVSENSTVPWLGFVGYQLRRSGRLRIRRASIEKELRKQQQAASRLLGRIGRRLHGGAGNRIVLPLSRGGIIGRFRQHMIAFGVGYPAPGAPKPADDALCWTRGFDLMVTATAKDREALRDLDRGRRQVISQLAGRLRGLSRNGHIRFTRRWTRQRRPWTLRFPGPPFSYSRQFDS